MPSPKPSKTISVPTKLLSSLIDAQLHPKILKSILNDANISGEQLKELLH